MDQEPSLPESSRKSFTIHDLAKAAGVGVRSVRLWVRQGLLPRPKLRGFATRYDRGTMLRVLAIRRLREKGDGLQVIKYKLGALSDEAVEAMLSRGDAAEAKPAEPATPATPAPLAGETWRRCVLVPGLELMVRTDGGALVERLAAEIVASYRAPSGG